VQVNSAFVALFRDLYPGCSIQLIAESKHIEALQSNAGDKMNGVSTQSFSRYSGAGFLYWPQKILGEWCRIFKTIRHARKSGPELLVWLSVFPTGHFLLQWLSRILLPAQKQLVILHAELEYLKPRQRSLPDRFLKAILKRALSRSGANISYIVLGEPIRKNLAQYRLVPDSRVSVVSHPFLYTEPIQKEKTRTRPLKICTFGTLKRAKNTQLFFDMADRFAEEIKAGTLSFSTVGKLSEDLYAYRSPYVHHYKPSEFVPQKEYEQEIRQYDLALFFYDNEGYSLSASGVVHECINLGIPFLALYNDYFDSIVQQSAVGKLFTSLNDMELYICKLCQMPDAHLENEFRLPIFSFIRQNSFLLQSEKLKRILEHQNVYIDS
jgi:hypothetical protein